MSVSSSTTCREQCGEVDGGGRAGRARKQRPPRSVHFFLPQAAIPQSQAWYAKIFGAKASQRNNAPVADIAGVQLRFAKAASAEAPTKGRILDPIGFTVKDLKAFIKLEANNIRHDRPSTVNDSGVGIAFITDPWGT
jgi:hypothetical protein